ncbi:transcriptional regulator with XRE-family HTH domain [Undibacterium sp. GrIS 1.8]|uniref:helix-turn-helix domain-containing protein n=1 Tax=unclassified Undibacterium TaxID=2630295 RepID=UPI00339A7E64
MQRKVSGLNDVSWRQRLLLPNQDTEVEERSLLDAIVGMHFDQNVIYLCEGLMSKSVSGEPVPPEVTGTFHYQELIESRLGTPIATELSNADAEKLASSPGAKLAAARNALGWSVPQVASQLKMAPRQIISIEADDYASLPEPAIVRGFIRAYAKLLKLDPVPIITLIKIDSDEKRQKLSTDRRASMSRVRLKTANEKKGRPLLKFVLGLLVLGIVALVWMVYR